MEQLLLNIILFIIFLCLLSIITIAARNPKGFAIHHPITYDLGVKGVEHSLEVKGVEHSLGIKGVEHSLGVKGVEHSLGVKGVEHSLGVKGVGPLYGGEIKKKINNFGDIAIDTLNIISFINNKPVHNQNEIITGIKYITPIIKKKYSGRIMFILKDKNTKLNTPEIRENYKKLAHELKIFIYITENYKGPTWKLEKRFDPSIHSQNARDDLYLLILANQFKCPVITSDNFRDILEFKGTIAPFKILIYDWFTIKQPIEDFIMPSNIESKKIYDYSKILKIKPIEIFNQRT